MAKPNRALRQSKAPTPAQLQRQKKQQSMERTERMAQAQYLKSYRHAQVAIARREAKAAAYRDAGIQIQQPVQQPQDQQKQPPAQAPKASGRKPPKPGKPATRGQKPSGKKPPRR